jgi:hypothetical protein
METTTRAVRNWYGQVDSVTRNAAGLTIVRLVPRLNGNTDDDRGIGAMTELSLTIAKTAAPGFQPGSVFHLELVEETPAPRARGAAAGKASG